MAGAEVAVTAAMLARGEVLGGYRIEDLVGIGGMAIVYRAEQLSLGRTVALKVLAPQLSRDAAFRERFRREGTHVAALDHPHVVTIYDSGEADGRLYLAMRLVEGITLAERMREDGLSAAATVSILTPIAAALDAAHARRARPPRRQAAEHPPGRRRPALPRRLRGRDATGTDGRADLDRRLRRQRPLRIARADPR